MFPGGGVAATALTMRGPGRQNLRRRTHQKACECVCENERVCVSPSPPAQRRKSPSPRVKTQEDLRRPSPKRWAKKCGPPAIGSPPCRRTPDYCDWRPLQGRCRPQRDPSSPTAPAGEAPAVTVEAREAPPGPPVTHTQTPSTGHPQATHRPSTARPAAARSPLGPRRPRSSFFLLGWRGEAISQKVAERQNLNASDGDPIPRAPVRRLLGPLSTEESRPGHWGACCAQRQTPTAGRAPRSLPLSCHQTRGWQAVRLESTRLVRPTVRWLRRWCHEDMTSTLLAAPRCPASVSAPKRPRLRSPAGRGARGHEVRGLVLDASHQTPSVAHAHVIIVWPGISSWVERARRGGGDGEGRG